MHYSEKKMSLYGTECVGFLFFFQLFNLIGNIFFRQNNSLLISSKKLKLVLWFFVHNKKGFTGIHSIYNIFYVINDRS